MSVVVLDQDGHPVTPETVLVAYRQRCFPMADSRAGRIAWYRPGRRAVITWDRWQVPRSLAKVLRREPYRLTVDRAFPAVVEACADRASTWISHDVQALYTELHRQGHAHSVEAWDADGGLVGGLYGLVIGGCFCGESMFHRAPDASKACVVHLVGLIRPAGFALIDCQQQTPHMERFGAREIDDRAYARLLAGCTEAVAWPVSADGSGGGG